MDIKESFRNVVAWAKSHPWLAGGIILLVILIAWWVSKQAGSSETSAQLGATGEEAPTDLGLSVGGGSGGLLDDLQNSIPVLPSVETPVIPNTPSVPQFDAGALMSPVAVADVGVGNFDAFYEAPTVSRNTSLAATTILAPTGSPSGFFSGNLGYDTKETIPTKIVSVAKSATPKKSGSSSSKNPAQQLGKGKNFTGYINGTYYVKGYPAAGSSLAAKTTITPSAGSQVSPSQGGGFFTGQYTDPTVKSSNKGSLTSLFGGSI